MEVVLFFTLPLAYILGSIPTSVWLGKIMFGIDVREFGSGNAGATNTFRVLGKKPGFAVLLIDFLKGFAASSLPIWFFYWVEPNSNKMINWQILHGAMAVLGHIYPVFAKFKGGKGIATLLGLAVSLSSYLAIVCVVLFVIMVWITKYISVGSMVAAATSPLVTYLLYGLQKQSLLVFCSFAAVLVVYTHRSNIKRIRNRTESKFTFNPKPLVSN
ncbi:MAG: glycerol-3-phosphate 1-O-acyltransferase PlsY [Bacteroidia bacterium]